MPQNIPSANRTCVFRFGMALAQESADLSFGANEHGLNIHQTMYERGEGGFHLKCCFTSAEKTIQKAWMDYLPP